MKPEAYADAHDRSHARRQNSADRTMRPVRLRDYLRWLTNAYQMETPNLDHSGTHVDDDGTPTMSGAAATWLGLRNRSEGPDNWLRVSSRVDDEGFYLTPLRRAMQLLPRERRILAVGLAVNALSPRDVTRLAGIPDWCSGDVVYRTVAMVWDKYAERAIPRTGPKSDAQLDAEKVA